MASKLFYLLAAAVCLLQVSLAARIARQEVPAAAPPGLLADISRQTSDFLTGLGSQVDQVMKAKDATELQNIFVNNTQIFAARVTDITNNLKEQFKSSTGDISKVVNQVVENLNQTVLKLQIPNPELKAKLKEVDENLQNSLKTVLAEVDRIAKTFGESTKGIQNDVSKFVKQAYDNVLETAQSLQKQLHEAANKA